MSRQRYEPVAQRDETIILDSIHGSPHYNYNSGLATSVASSHYTPSETTNTPSLSSISIPNSPPPSFHTHSSPGTPRPGPSQASHDADVPPYASLWGVAQSTIGGSHETNTTITTSNDALATITGLKQRIEWLEESIGRLLLEKEAGSSASSSSNSNGDGGSAHKKERDNCCVTFTDASPDLERAVTNGKGSNCCVTFRSGDQRRNRGPIKLVLGIVFMVCLTVVLVAEAGARGKRYSGQDSGSATVGMELPGDGA